MRVIKRIKRERQKRRIAFFLMVTILSGFGIAYAQTIAQISLNSPVSFPVDI